jgi:hypothetical protein
MPKKRKKFKQKYSKINRNLSIQSLEKTIGFNTILTFGKYKGNTCLELISIDKNYLIDMIKHIYPQYKYSNLLLKKLNILY